MKKRKLRNDTQSADTRAHRQMLLFHMFRSILPQTQTDASLTGSGTGTIEPYHSSLPDDAHAVLDAREPVGDLGEVVFAHSFLFDGERTVVGDDDV